ncbi:hypothetical protein [Campylobacter sp.]|uniref:hypothetical protein n=1 Tax=Campylobacter sp. TaxID=205 RepID=UPI0027104059|nr:hypothetical protein [Campylobacter sp.]
MIDLIAVLIAFTIFFIICKLLYVKPKFSREKIWRLGLNEDVKRLSFRPFLLGFEKFAVSKEELCFDETFLYVIKDDEVKTTIKFEDILELKKGRWEINNVRIWHIKTEESLYKFAPINNFLNKNFTEFLAILKNKNSQAIKSKKRNF